MSEGQLFDAPVDPPQLIDGDPEPTPAPKLPVWRVEIRREQEMVFLIAAPDKDTARADAEEMHISEGDWYQAFDNDYWAEPVGTRQKDDPVDVWTGGPDGDWVPYEEYVS